MLSYITFNENRISFRTLTHRDRVTHICVSKLTIIGSDNGLSPGRCQAIISNQCWNIVNWVLRTNFSEILIEVQRFSFKKMRLKMSSENWRPFCIGLNVLTLYFTGHELDWRRKSTGHISHCQHWLTPEVRRDFSTFRSNIWMTSSSHRKLIRNHDI